MLQVIKSQTENTHTGSVQGSSVISSYQAMSEPETLSTHWDSFFVCLFGGLLLRKFSFLFWNRLSLREPDWLWVRNPPVWTPKWLGLQRLSLTLLHSPWAKHPGKATDRQTEIMRHKDGNKSKNTKDLKKHKQTDGPQSYKWSHRFLV